VEGGLGNVWLGTACLVGALLLCALTFLIGSASEAFFASNGRAGTDKVEQVDQATDAAGLVRGLLLGGGGLCAFLTATGGALRLIGSLRCTFVPAGTGARVPAIVWLAADAVALGSSGLLMMRLFAEWDVERLLALLRSLPEQGAPAIALPRMPLLLLAGAVLVGLGALLVFSASISRALHSKELPKRLKRFLGWLIFAALVSGVALGGRYYLRTELARKLAAEGERAYRYSWEYETYHYTYYGSLVLYVALLLLVLLKYLGLLGLASDEARKRASKWQLG